jgi:hypothetical protein
LICTAVLNNAVVHESTIQLVDDCTDSTRQCAELTSPVIRRIDQNYQIQQTWILSGRRTKRGDGEEGEDGDGKPPGVGRHGAGQLMSCWPPATHAPENVFFVSDAGRQDVHSRALINQKVSSCCTVQQQREQESAADERAPLPSARLIQSPTTH